MALQVNAGAIVVPVKGTDRYLYRGAILPEGVEADDIKRLKSIGLVKDVKVQTKPRAAAGKSTGKDDANTGTDSGADAGADEAGKAQSQNAAEDGASTESEGSKEEPTESEANDASADDAPKTRSRAKK